jgi:hypothetical protein
MHIEYSPDQSQRDINDDVLNDDEEKDVQFEIQDEITSSYSGNSGYSDERSARDRYEA